MFRQIVAVVLFSTAVMAVPAWAGPSPAELEATKVALERGKLMYRYDQAAWHATDSFQADLRKADLDNEKLADLGLRGYVVEPAEGELLLTTFFGEKGGQKFAFARYWVAGSEVKRGGILKEGDDRSLSPLATRLTGLRAKALDAAIEAKVTLCSKSPLNSIVLPPEKNGIASAYIMTSTNVAGIYPAGGHYRFDFDAEDKLVSSRPFMKTCFPLDTRSEEGKKPEALVLTHLLDPQPTEIHVFVEYNIPVPLYVMTTSNERTWRIDKGRIIFVDKQ
jgi:hypothetical protein